MLWKLPIRRMKMSGLDSGRIRRAREFRGEPICPRFLDHEIFRPNSSKATRVIRPTSSYEPPPSRAFTRSASPSQIGTADETAFRLAIRVKPGENGGY